MRCSGPEDAKHRTSLGKSTDVLPQKYGCFASKVRMFSSKNSIKKSPLEGKDIMSECTSPLIPQHYYKYNFLST